MLGHSTAYGLEIKTRYATITYESQAVLKKFNSNLYIGKLRYLIAGEKNETVEDEVRNKIDMIVEKVESILDMFPVKIKFSIVIHESKSGIHDEFYRIYKKDVDYIAFYSPTENTVFYSARNASLRVVAHEIGHVVVEHYFAISPPPKIHEVLAQYAEMHITD
jgi:hypothetical protein